MRRTSLLLLLTLAAMTLCGCLSKSRSPYNEVAFFSADTVNAWPFYLGDGRTHYVLWPFIKASPECFAVLPFYNYDDGIHDICLLFSAVPERDECRLWPFFYYKKGEWILFPLAYYFGEDFYGSPLLHNHVDKHHVGHLDTYLNLVILTDDKAKGWLFLPLAWWIRSERDLHHGLLPLWVWSSDEDETTCWTPLSFYSGDRHETTLWTPLCYYNGSRDQDTWHTLNIGPLGLPFWAREETPTTTFRRQFLVSHKQRWDKDRREPDAKRTLNAWGVGFNLIWDWCDMQGHDGMTGRSWSFLTDFLAHSDTTQTWEVTPHEQGKPLSPITNTRRSRSNAFGWLLWRSSKEDIVENNVPGKYSSWFTPLISRSTTESDGTLTESKTGFLLNAFTWETHDGAYAGSSLLWDWLFCDTIHTRDDRRDHSTSVLLPFGLLWDSYHTVKRTKYKRPDFGDEQSVLCGLLYDHTRTRYTEDFMPRGDKPEYRDYSKTTLLCGLLYKQRRNVLSDTSKVLFGLLYDREKNLLSGSESWGILGYLYRASHAADASHTRFALPGLLWTTHDDSDDWAFSFLGGLFGLESTADDLDWTLFWL